MNKKWFRILYFLPFVLILLFVNIKTDINEQIGKAIIAGNCVGFPNASINERQVKKNVITNMPKYVDTLVFGPSLVMEIRKNDVGTESFYNLGHSSLNYDDLMAQFGLLEYCNIKFNRAIICLDFYVLDDVHNTGSWNSKLLKKYSDHMKNILFNKKDKNDIIICFEETIAKLNILFSITNFKKAITSKIFTTSNFEIFDDSVKKLDCAYYKPDASWVYAKDFQENSVDFVYEKCDSVNLPEFRSQYHHINKQRKAGFEKLIKYLKDKNIDIELFLCPHPSLIWNKMHLDNSYPIVKELNDFAIELSTKYNCKVTGSYNPYDLNIQLEDFYDAAHVRHEKLSKYFDFKTR